MQASNYSNIACNNALFNSFKIPPMHKSMERLYEAAKTLKGKEGQSEVARLLNESPQVLNNWEARGVSGSGALSAQRYIGCDANWILDGIKRGEPVVVIENAAPAYVPSGQVETTSQSESDWPFLISRNRYELMSERDKGRVEGFMMALAQATEAVQKKIANGS